MGARIELRAALALPIVFGIFALCFGTCAAIPEMPPSGHIVLALVALFFLSFAILLGRRRLIIDDSGITARGMFATRQLGWNEVDHYTFWSMDQQMMYAVGAGSVDGAILIGIIALVVGLIRSRRNPNRRFATGSLTIIGNTKVVIDTRYARITDALDPIFDRLHTVVGPRRDFAPFSLSASELVHAKKGPIALADIEKISVGRGRLTIKKRGKRLSWLGIHMKQIHNGLLFIEALGEAGLIVDAKAGMFVPPTVLGKLHAATARQQAMPAARVVRRD